MLFLSETSDLREKLWSRLSIHTSISINCTWFGLSKFAVYPACLVSSISLNSELANVYPNVYIIFDRLLARQGSVLAQYSDGNDIDRSFAHCVLFVESGHQRRGTIKYCGGTTNLTNYLTSCHNGLGVVNCGFISHHVDIFQIDFCSCIIKTKKRL